MRIRRLIPGLAGLLFLVGCQDREIRAYRVPREEPARPPGVAAAPSATPTAGALQWSAPDHWQEKPAGGFRRGSYTVPGAEGAEADLSIIAFPGDAGGLVENLNRWRGQIGLPPLTESDSSSAIEHVDGPNGLHFDVVDFSGTAGDVPTRIVGAVVSHGGESWFFKLMGPAATVAAEKAAFLQFLQSVSPATP